ncbi:MAG: hypothetical protein C3F11_18050 [Methylocystaceae bacterium]|nr:MAG: hypothetical protein C3F11_18050 [Methylocystaceae bacterium]
MFRSLLLRGVSAGVVSLALVSSPAVAQEALPTIDIGAAVELFSQLAKAEDLRSGPETQSRVSLDEALAIAARRFPDGRVYAFVPPQPQNGSYAVYQLFPIGWGFEGRRTIYVDRFRGDVLHVNDPLSGDGDGFIAWQWPLHSGYVLGWPGRIAVFLFGLSWPLVFVTGVIRWLQKRRAAQNAG